MVRFDDSKVLTYPMSEQFPFDAVCEQIVRSLELRDWKSPAFPELEVEFSTQGEVQKVFKIEASQFKLIFSRRWDSPQNKAPNFGSAVSMLWIPRKELSVCADESGPCFYVYVGSDWENDRLQFMRSAKINSKLMKKPRTYLLYRGSFYKREDPLFNRAHPGMRPTYLVHNNNLEREYDLADGDPADFVTADIFEEFRIYLADEVLAKIEQHS